MTATLDRHMRLTDAFAWNMERDPLLRSTVVVVGRLDRVPDLAVLRATIDRGTRAVPGFRDRIVVPPLRLARPRWVRVDELDLDWHVRKVSAPSPGGLAEVLQIARTAATPPSTRPGRSGRSPWWTGWPAVGRLSCSCSTTV